MLYFFDPHNSIKARFCISITKIFLNSKFVMVCHCDYMQTIVIIIFSFSDKTKLTLLESQAKLIDIMEAYKKGASLTDVERMHNEWKILYQVSDLEAKVIQCQCNFNCICIFFIYIFISHHLYHLVN